jgi:predicted transcriptional regulator
MNELVVISAKVDAATREKLDRLAEQTSRTRGGVIRELCKMAAYVEARDLGFRKHGLVAAELSSAQPVQAEEIHV